MRNVRYKEVISPFNEKRQAETKCDGLLRIASLAFAHMGALVCCVLGHIHNNTPC